MPLFFLAWVGNFVTSKSWCIRWHKGQYCFILPVANVSPSLEWNNSSYGRCQLLFNPHRMTNCFWFIFGSVPLIWRLTYCFWAISLLRKILGAWCFWTVFFIIGLAFSPRDMTWNWWDWSASFKKLMCDSDLGQNTVVLCKFCNHLP